MRFFTSHRMALGVRLLCALALLSAAIPVFAHGPNELRIAESNDESVQIAAGRGEAARRCVSGGGRTIDMASAHAYSQKLNSEVGEDAVYLKAARMGGGIYMHLPYFLAGDCKGVGFHVSARHILWQGKWHSGSLSISSEAAQDNSVFFTNEAAPLIKGGRYFDAGIPAVTLARLQAAFDQIISFYEKVLEAEPMRGVGVVAAIVRNNGNYTGFGGDALNIIRMSYDNPTANGPALDQVFPATFAHELAHKLQSERLFQLPLARHIVEGSADFIKIVVLHNAGVIDEEQAKDRVRKAAADCAKFSDARTLRAKAGAGSFSLREPYDCGMVYYFVSYYASGMQGPRFVDALRSALKGEGRDQALCLMFEPTCANERLIGVAGDRDAYLQQMAWLESQLATRPLPALTPTN